MMTQFEFKTERNGYSKDQVQHYLEHLSKAYDKTVEQYKLLAAAHEKSQQQVAVLNMAANDLYSSLLSTREFIDKEIAKINPSDNTQGGGA